MKSVNSYQFGKIAKGLVKCAWHVDPSSVHYTISTRDIQIIIIIIIFLFKEYKLINEKILTFLHPDILDTIHCILNLIFLQII